MSCAFSLEPLASTAAEAADTSITMSLALALDPLATAAEAADTSIALPLALAREPLATEVEAADTSTLPLALEALATADGATSCEHAQMTDRPSPDQLLQAMGANGFATRTFETQCVGP